MMTTRTVLPALAMTVVLLAGCQDGTDPVTAGDAQQGLTVTIPADVRGGNPRTEVWADCELFASVVTPATFDPDSDPFDQLYGGGNGFLNGVGIISEAKPGDPDYNGGRWHLNTLKADVDPDKYANACSVEDLDLADFEGTADYFECPLLPRRGRN